MSALDPTAIKELVGALAAAGAYGYGALKGSGGNKKATMGASASGRSSIPNAYGRPPIRRRRLRRMRSTARRLRRRNGRVLTRSRRRNRRRGRMRMRGRRSGWNRIKKRLRNVRRKKPDKYMCEFGEVRDAGTRIGTSLWMGQSNVQSIDGFWGVNDITLAGAQGSDMAINEAMTLTTRDTATFHAVLRHAARQQWISGTDDKRINAVDASTTDGISNPALAIEQVMRSLTGLVTWDRKLSYDILNDTRFGVTVTIYYFRAKKEVDLVEIRDTTSMAADLDTMVSRQNWIAATADATGNYYNNADVTSLPQPNKDMIGGVTALQNVYQANQNSTMHTPYKSKPFTTNFKITGKKSYELSPGQILKLVQKDPQVYMFEERVRSFDRTNRINVYLRGTQGILIKAVGQIISGSGLTNLGTVTTAPPKLTLRTIYSFKYKTVSGKSLQSRWDLNAHTSFRRSGINAGDDLFDTTGDINIGPVPVA